MTKQTMLESLNGREAQSVMRMLVIRRPELREEIELLAKDALQQVDFSEVAPCVLDALNEVDKERFSGRAGRHRDGYTEPSEAAWQLLEEAVEPFIEDMKRYISLGLDEQALEQCKGIALGVYEFSQEKAPSEVSTWAGDEFPEYIAGWAVDIWLSDGNEDDAAHKRFNSHKSFPTDFVQKHLPDWEWLAR